MALIPGGAVYLPREQHPHPGPHRYGLFTVAPPQQIMATERDPNLADHALGSGLFYDPIACGEPHLYEISCTPPAPEKDFDDNSPEVRADPFVVYGSLQCAPGGYSTAYLVDKTNNRLFATEQHAAEFAFWTGGAVNAQPRIDDPAGAVDVGAAGTFPNLTAAVAALENFAYNTAFYGFHAVLHANSAVAAYAADAHLAHSAHMFGHVWGVPQEDRALRTTLGTKWIFGGGYPGTGPDGLAPGPGETYIWITGHVAVWRDASWRPPDPNQVMNRATNQHQLIAERRYIASYECFHAYALVAIPEVAA